MRKRNTIPLLAWGGLAVTILMALSISGSPVVEGSYAQIRFNPNLYASYLGEDTKLVGINMIDSDDITYSFTATGETILNIPENTIIENITVWVRIEDNYASSEEEAIARTRIEVIMTDPDSVVQYGDNFEGAENAGATNFGGVWDYYLVIRDYDVSITLGTGGTWDLDSEYLILSLPL